MVLLEEVCSGQGEAGCVNLHHLSACGLGREVWAAAPAAMPAPADSAPSSWSLTYGYKTQEASTSCFGLGVGGVFSTI